MSDTAAEYESVPKADISGFCSGSGSGKTGAPSNRVLTPLLCCRYNLQSEL